MGKKKSENSEIEINEEEVITENTPKQVVFADFICIGDVTVSLDDYLVWHCERPDIVKEIERANLRELKDADLEVEIGGTIIDAVDYCRWYRHRPSELRLLEKAEKKFNRDMERGQNPTALYKVGYHAEMGALDGFDAGADTGFGPISSLFFGGIGAVLGTVGGVIDGLFSVFDDSDEWWHRD